jgi:hypothetical protein
MTFFGIFLKTFKSHIKLWGITLKSYGEFVFVNIIIMTNDIESISSNYTNHVNCEKWNPYKVFFLLLQKSYL